MSVRILIAALLVSLQISSQEAAPRETSATLQIYEVRDLVAPEGRSDQQIAQATTELRSLLMVALSGHPEIDCTAKGTLVVRGMPDEHHRLRQVLDDLRRAEQPQILMKFVIAWMPIAGDEPDHEGVDVESLEAFDPETRFEGGEVLTAPSVLTLAYQEAVIQTGSTVRIIEGYDRVDDVEGHPEGLVVPRLKEIHEGLRIETSPVPSLDRKFVTVSINLKFDELVRPVPVVRSEHGPVHVTPAIHTQGVATTVVVPESGTFVLRRGVTDAKGERRRLCVLVSVETLR
jgi:hypothetical protein